MVGSRPGSKLAGQEGDVGVGPTPEGHISGLHPLGLAEQRSDFIHFHAEAQLTPVRQVSPSGRRLDGPALRWLALDDGLQLTYPSFEVGVCALEELDSAKEAGGRRVLPCRD